MTEASSICSLRQNSNSQMDFLLIEGVLRSEYTHTNIYYAIMRLLLRDKDFFAINIFMLLFHGAASFYFIMIINVLLCIPISFCLYHYAYTTKQLFTYFC